MPPSGKCCLCLIKLEIDAKNIYTEFCYDQPLYSIINTLFTFELQFNQPSPENETDMICEICSKSVTEFHEFYMTIKKIHSSLLNVEHTVIKAEDEQLLPDKIFVKNEELMIRLLPEGSSNIESYKNIIEDDDFDPLNICEEDDSPENTFNNHQDTHFSDNCSNSSQVSSHIAQSGKKLNKVPDRKQYEETENMIRSFFNIDCELCNDSFNTFYELVQHFRKIHKVRRGYIKCCKSKLTNYSLLREHLNWHQKGNLFTCTLCDKSFGRKLILDSHMINIHTDESDKKFDCPHCGRKFTRASFRQEHVLRSHPADGRCFKCDICDRDFTTLQAVSVHKKNVHTEAKVVCELCGKMFKTRSACNTHNLRYHTDAVKCEICGEMIKNQLKLKMHISRNHDATNVPGNCPTCGKLCKDRQTLRKHITFVHLQKPNFHCSYCEKSFKSSFKLREHEATHTGIDIYSCPYCPRTFKTSGNVGKHKKVKHKEEYEFEKSKKDEALLQNNLN